MVKKLLVLCFAAFLIFPIAFAQASSAPPARLPSLNAALISHWEAQTKPCTVSTTQSKTAAVRVGPGTNRSTVAFLKANTDYTVLGQAKAKDGSLWWKLDKKQAAPNKSANETWVADKDVTTKGDCKTVSAAAAPPVIPVTKPKPTPEPGATAQPSGTQTLPVAGSWTMTISTNVYVNCGGNGSGYETVPEFGKSVEFKLTVERDGSAIYLDGSPLALTSPGVYSGRYDLSTDQDIVFATITLNVISDKRLEGQVLYELQGCSVAASLVATHN